MKMESEYSSTDQQNSNENQAELYYKKSVDLQTRDGITLINKTLLVEGHMVLDLGCGTGNLTAVLAEKVGPTGHVIGIDPDIERIKVAKEHNKNTNVTFEEAAGDTFPEGKYDLVFSNYVLHWIEDKEAVFKRVYTNLRPGGQFALTLCQAPPPLATECLKAMNPENAKAHLQKVFCVSTEKIEQLAAGNSFRMIHKETGISRLLLPSFESAFELVFASSHGEINPSVFIKDRLERLRQKYANKSVEFSEEYATYIFVKGP